MRPHTPSGSSDRAASRYIEPPAGIFSARRVALKAKGSGGLPQGMRRKPAGRFGPVGVQKHGTGLAVQESRLDSLRQAR